MDLGLISVRYARALLKAGTEAKLENDVYKEMQSLSESYVNVPELKFTIDNPMLSKDDKEQLFLTAVGGKPCELTRTFIKLVLKEDRESMMQFIANSYITLYRKQKNCAIVVQYWRDNRRIQNINMLYVSFRKIHPQHGALDLYMADYHYIGMCM